MGAAHARGWLTPPLSLLRTTCLILGVIGSFFVVVTFPSTAGSPAAPLASTRLQCDTIMPPVPSVISRAAASLRCWFPFLWTQTQKRGCWTVW